MFVEWKLECLDPVFLVLLIIYLSKAQGFSIKPLLVDIDYILYLLLFYKLRSSEINVVPQVMENRQKRACTPGIMLSNPAKLKIFKILVIMVLHIQTHKRRLYQCPFKSY